MDVRDFRNAFSVLAAGVSVITFSIDAHTHGFTATSLTPVSADPPLALFCVGRANTSHSHLKRGTLVGMSILGCDQKTLSTRFAAKAEIGGYADIDITNGEHGAAVLSGALAVLEGEIVELYPAGDHTIFLCSVKSAKCEMNGAPLLYCLRDYHALAALSD